MALDRFVCDGYTSIKYNGALLSEFMLAVACLLLPWFGARLPVNFVGVGLLWLVLTLVFGYSFGLWQGKSWNIMLEVYTFKGGNIWPIVLAASAFAPFLVAKLRGVID